MFRRAAGMLSAICWSGVACAAESIEPGRSSGIDEAIDSAVAPVSEAVSSLVFYSVPFFDARLPLVVLWLVAGSVFCTLYFGFINIRGIRHALCLIRGDYDDPNDSGEVSHFQALATAVSGTVGIGNIGAVAIAITLGGPGATFWMIIAGFLGMSTKFCECVLGVKYRSVNEDGSVSGGPMYYLRRGLAERGFDRTGQGVGAFYAVGIVVGCLGIGNMFQSNQAYVQFVSVTGGSDASWFADKGWLFGGVLALVVGSVIIGGIRSIARVTEKIVPFMAILYVSSALVIIVLNREGLPFALAAIVTGAFSAPAVVGGGMGAMIIGFQRAVFSNEAGIGSASIAHSAVRTNEPVSEGLVALLEPFIDTVVICTLTALVIITTLHYEPGFLQSEAGGIAMTSAAFERNIAWFPYPLSLAAILFAFSTMIAWSYYGLKGWTYLVGEGKRAEIAFKMFYCLFVALGATIKIDNVLSLSDALVFVICVPNIVGLYVLAPTVKSQLQSYLTRVQSGEIVNYRHLRRQDASVQRNSA